MLLLSQIKITCAGEDAFIQLLHGDLTAIPKEHAADILVISAYPNDYSTVDKKTLMSALYNKGIVVADLAKDKEIDLLANLNCWLSKPLSKAQQDQFNFKKILCFEPPSGNEKEKVVANIFRCINTFAYDTQNNIIAMPVLASGNQKVPMDKMLPAIIDASLFWLESGLPLNCIKLVLYSEEQVESALPLFLNAKQQYDLKKAVQNGNVSASEAWNLQQLRNRESSIQAAMPIVATELEELTEKEKFIARSTIPIPPPAPAPAPAPASMPVSQPASASKEEVKKETHKNQSSKTYDLFISYSHKHAPQVKIFVETILEKKPELNIFYDRTTIPAGGLWIKLISDAIQNSNTVICILSPEYSASDVCWDEFQCAKAKEYRTKQSIIKTINFYNDANLPLIMSIYSYIDCTEGDIDKLKNCVTDLL